MISGSFEPGRGPDGNSIFIDAPDGLILIDSGRHPAHRDTLLAYAAKRGRPIVAIINSHWHFDHTTGNREILTAHPKAEVIASTAIDGDHYRRFGARSRQGAEAHLASGKASAAEVAEIRRGLAAMDDPGALRPTRPVTATAPMKIGGRTLEVHLEPFAVSEGDVWVYDPRSKVAFAGDLVVTSVPFMDTACPEGWRKALGRLAAAPWTRLVPGHGPELTRQQFSAWRSAFDRFVDCGISSAPEAMCAQGWVRDARAFIEPRDAKRMQEMAAYYVRTRLRPAAGRQEFCPDRPA